VAFSGLTANSSQGLKKARDASAAAEGAMMGVIPAAAATKGRLFSIKPGWPPSNSDDTAIP
jgi:hypothetical protein